MAIATSTLSKFGVPLDGANLGILHPKQQYRFRVIWQGFGTGQGLRQMTGSVVTCTRPKITYNEVELHSYNSVAWIQGKHKFDPIEIKIRDDITNSVASSVGAQIQKQMNHFEQTSAVAGINYKFAMQIHSMDGTSNDELESWVLEGCWITNVSYSDGDYSKGEDQQITMSIRYDNATNLTGQNNTNLGTTVGGDPFPNIQSPMGGTSAL